MVHRWTSRIHGWNHPVLCPLAAPSRRITSAGLTVNYDKHPLRTVLDRIGPESCPGKLNFHCHTLCSDGSLEPIALIKQASERQLSHIAVTDHHSTAAYLPMLDWLQQARDQGNITPKLWSGMEISCILRGCLVHVLALGFIPGHRALLTYCSGDAATGAEQRGSGAAAAQRVRKVQRIAQ